MGFMYGDLSNTNQEFRYPDAKYGIKDSEEYNIKYESAIERAKSFNIWSFEEIGMFDPFPEEPMETNFSVPQSEEDLVYRIDRYIDGESPKCIYVPSKLILWKIMRACIGI